ncbi:MAG: SBBP repeat-containing protein [Bacteroidia bacterium]|nr:SBBP repeat-containing protein [Bacteroidia bacterium]
MRGSKFLSIGLLWTFLLVFIMLSGAAANIAQAGSMQGSGMRFTQNKGQIADVNGGLCPDILFKGGERDADVYLRRTGISFVMNNMADAAHNVDEELEKLEGSGGLIETDENNLKRKLLSGQAVKLHRVDVEFVNCNSKAAIVAEHQVEGYSNFYYAHCPQGILNVNSYDEITLKNIYNSIDVKYYACPEQSRRGGKETGLKYDLIVNPGGNPDDIKLKYSGADELTISNGRLKIKTSINEYEEYIPRVYQNINGEIIDVLAKYILTLSPSGRAGEGLVNFQLGTWNPHFPLIIDPATWITYYGGSGAGQEEAASVAADALGNSVYSGRVSTTGFPVSVGAAQVTLGGSIDAFVVKMNAAGGRVFATYFGGSGFDTGEGIDADINNEIYLTGAVLSANFPTKVWTGAFMQAAYSGGGGADAYVAKFSVTGALIWSTYYGRAGDDWGMDVITDALGNITFAGYTSSAIFPTQAPFQAAINGPVDGFIVKFNNAGVRQWATYYGGPNPGGVVSEFIYGITVDPSNNIYVCGKTNSNTFPTLLAFQPVNGGAVGTEDAFIFRLNPVTGFPVWSTYYGGTGQDAGTAIAADGLGNVFLGLSTSSITAIATAGAYQTILNGPRDAALIKFATTTGTRVWGTYLGGSAGSVNTGQDYATGLDVDSRNNIILGGDTYSSDFPVTSCSYQTTFKGSEDIFISTFDQQGKLICSGLLGENLAAHNETYYRGGSIAVSGSYVFLHAWSFCNFPVTPGAYQTSCGGASDVTFSKLCIYSCGLPNTTANFTSPVTVCSGAPVNFTLTNTSCDTVNTTYLWSFAGGSPSSAVSHDPANITWNSPGTYGVSVKIMSPCDTITISNPNYISITSCTTCNLTAQFTKGTSDCTSCGCKEWIMVTATGGTSPYTYLWPDGYSNRYKNNLCPGTQTIDITDKNGCSINVNLTVP